MEHFLRAIVQPTAVLMFFVILFALGGYIYPYYKSREGIWLWPILWVILAILAFIAWCFLVFG